MSTTNTPLPQFMVAAPSRWARVTGARHAWNAAAAMIGYLLAVVAANIASVHWPPLVLGGLAVPAGTVFAGTTLTARDLVHDRLRARRVVVGIAAGTGLSAVLASPQIAVASVVAFTASEIVDALIYTRLHHRSRMTVVAASNTGGFILDSALFVPLAFASLTAVPGQLVGKAVATLLTLAAPQIASVIARREVTRP